MPLPTGKARFWLIVFSVFAFFGPFFAILGIEANKRLTALRAEKESYAKSLSDTASDREQYQLFVNAQKQTWQQKMTEAKNQYDNTKATQAEAIANNQKTVTVNEPRTTTYTPPPVAKTVSTSTSKTTTRKTKTS